MEHNLVDEEISFKELIKCLLTHWKYIVGFPLVFGIAAFVYFWMVVSPTYEARIQGIINIPETVETQYGAYAFSENTANDILAYVVSDRVMEQWIQATENKDSVQEASVEQAILRVTVKKDENSNQFTIRLKAKSPELAKEHLKVLSRIFIEEVNLRYKKMALNYFSTQLNNSIIVAGNEKEVIEKQLIGFEEMLASIDPAISLKRLMLSNPVYAAQVAKERGIPQELLTEEMMLEEVINPNYQSLEQQIIEIKKRIGVIDVENELNKRHLRNIKVEDEAITKRLFGDSAVTLNDNFLNVTNTTIVIKDNASGDKSPIAPKKTLSLAIALVLGLMIGVFVAFFIAYWKRDELS